MSKQLLHALFNKEFYLHNKDLITEDLFSDSNIARDIFRAIEKAYGEGSGNLTVEEVKLLYDTYYAAEPLAKKKLCHELLKEFEGQAPIQESVALLVLKQARLRRMYDDAAQNLLESSPNLDKIKEILYDSERLNNQEVSTNIVDMDIDNLLSRTSKNSRWKFNIPALSDMAGGLGDSIFCLIGGRIESGKSLTALSLCYSPNGFADQGAKILHLCNEEDAAFAGIRAVSSFTGFKISDMEANKEQVAKTFAKIRKNVIILEDAHMSMGQLVKQVEHYKPDIVVVDVLDHLVTPGEFAREDLRLGRIYRQAREIAKTYSCAFIGVSQLSAEADGKMIVGFDTLASSKTDKAAACDLILLLGQNAPDDKGNYSMDRAINVAKNKITGKHGAVYSYIMPELTRLCA